jgi:hypothetical protein
MAKLDAIGIANSRSKHRHERLNTQDRDHPFDIVSQDAQAHFSFDALEASRQEVRVRGTVSSPVQN